MLLFWPVTKINPTQFSQKSEMANFTLPRGIPFILNRLQCMVNAQLVNYEEVNRLAFLQELQNRPPSEVNQKRLDVIVVNCD